MKRTKTVKKPARKAKQELHKRIEALLLIPAEPMTITEIADILDADTAKARAAIKLLQRKDSAFTLTKDAAGWRFKPKQQYKLNAAVSIPHDMSIPHDDKVTAEVTHQASRESLPFDEHHATYKEFMDDLNSKVSMIAHHNSSNATDERLRAKMIAEIEGLLHPDQK